MYQIDFMISAIDDMSEIDRYIRMDLKNPSAADRLWDKIKNSTDKLADMPYRHSLVFSDFPLDHEYRRIIIDNYSVLYYIDEASKIVRIVKIYYSRRNLKKLIK